MEYDDYFEWGSGGIEVFRRHAATASEGPVSDREILMGRCKDAERDLAAAREWLWLHHGCDISGLYGDDGEMQCGQGHVEDYKRAPLLDILKRQFERTQCDLAAAQTKLSNAINTEFREQSRLIGERDAARDLVEQEKTHSSDLFEQKERLRYERDELKKRIAALLAVKETA